MNILLWIFQAALAFLFLSGGAYKVFKVEDLVGHAVAISEVGWRALGVLEVLGAILLIVPAALSWMPVLTPVAAAVLALESLTLAGLFARHSLEIAATNPMVWNLAMGIMAVFVAYGRFALSPTT